MRPKFSTTPPKGESKRTARSGHRAALPLPATTGLPLNESLLDADDVGRRLKLSPRTVADMANAGRLPAYRIGTFLRFKWADIEQFITANYKVRAGGSATGNGTSPAVAARHALPHRENLKS